ncbi:MAG TPA: hypothetical protein VNK26_06340, partial [Pyrinomonadaceae bacterium]|nr:hypothetical protein [Pyrinomonadaceae bacterium]
SLNTLGVKLLRTPVGDKYVLEEMLKTGSELGGEQSGHIIIANYGLIGDGLKSSLAVLAALGSLDASIEDVLADLKIFPQRLINIPVSEKRPFEKIPSIDEAIKESEKMLNGKGRIIVRYSGTENLARVMVEGEDESLVNQIAERISSEINAAIGLKN